MRAAILHSLKGPLFLISILHLVAKGWAIHCWECNSKFDARCSDNFSNFSVALVDCDQRQSTVEHLDAAMEEWVEDGEATSYASMCRKTVQTVEGETRVIRGCGWVKNFGFLRGRACFNRAGTKEIQMFHCVCRENGCNSSLPSTPFNPILTALSLLISCLVILRT